MSDPASCAACARPVDLGEPHITIVRQVEWEDEWGNTRVQESVVFTRHHQSCAEPLPGQFRTGSVAHLVQGDGEVERCVVTAVRRTDRYAVAVELLPDPEPR